MHSEEGGALTTGLTGAVALTLAHQGLRALVPHAPRIDVLGMRGVARILHAAGISPPTRDQLWGLALLSDLTMNAGLYALVHGLRSHDRSHNKIARGLLLGALAGAAVVALPKRLGLGRFPRGLSKGSNGALGTQGMTLGLYMFGGLAAAVASKVISARNERRTLAAARDRAPTPRNAGILGYDARMAQSSFGAPSSPGTSAKPSA
ncbi:MAG: hypothetical protein NVS3B20_17150 [Polyangiales bacterium]